jgi:hypothetical protein
MKSNSDAVKSKCSPHINTSFGYSVIPGKIKGWKGDLRGDGIGLSGLKAFMATVFERNPMRFVTKADFKNVYVQYLDGPFRFSSTNCKALWCAVEASGFIESADTLKLYGLAFKDANAHRLAMTKWTHIDSRMSVYHAAMMNGDTMKTKVDFQADIPLSPRMYTTVRGTGMHTIATNRLSGTSSSSVPSVSLSD